MPAGSENEISNQSTDSVSESQSQESSSERMFDETQQGGVAQTFGQAVAEQSAIDSRNMVQSGALPDLQFDDFSDNSQGGNPRSSWNDSATNGQAQNDASQFKDPAMDSLNDALKQGSAESNQYDGRDNYDFHQGADAQQGNALEQKDGGKTDKTHGEQNHNAQEGKTDGEQKTGSDKSKPESEAAKPDPELTPAQPVTFEDIQPSGYIPGAGGIEGGKWDMHDRKAPTTADFFNKNNPSDYVSMAVDGKAHVKDGQLFYSKELDEKYADQLAEKYPDQKPEDRHMWLRAVDKGGAFKGTWQDDDGPSRVDIAVPKYSEADKINEHGPRAKHPDDAISLTMVPESDNDRVDALAKMPTSPGHKHISGLDFGYRDEKKKPVRLD